MSVLDGPGLPQSIQHSGKALPAIIFVSEFWNVESALSNTRGVYAVLQKPFSSTLLLETAAKSLARRDEISVAPF